MSETPVPTPFERFPPARPALGPRAPTTRARRTFWALLALAVALTIYVVWPFRAPLFLAAVLAAAFQPLLARTERLLKGRRGLGRRAGERVHHARGLLLPAGGRTAPHPPARPHLPLAGCPDRGAVARVRQRVERDARRRGADRRRASRPGHDRIRARPRTPR